MEQSLYYQGTEVETDQETRVMELKPMRAHRASSFD